MNILLVRHGEILANRNRVYAGRSDEGLTPKGIIQADEVTEKLKECKVQAIYSSPVRRAHETADIISTKIGRPVIVEDAFREMELGPWEGLSEGDVARVYPEEWKTWHSKPAELKLPGRETLDELLKRVLSGLQKIKKDAAQGDVVIITHVAIIRVVLLWHASKSLNLYKTIHVPNAEIFQIKVDAYTSL